MFNYKLQANHSLIHKVDFKVILDLVTKLKEVILSFIVLQNKLNQETEAGVTLHTIKHIKLLQLFILK